MRSIWSMRNVSAMPSQSLGVGVVPAGIELFERQLVGLVAVDLVCAHVHEGRFGRTLARGLQHVQCADRIDVEIVERASGGEVVAGLGGACTTRSKGPSLRNSRRIAARSRMSPA